MNAEAHFQNYAELKQGDYTDEVDNHLDRASALATSFVGAGFDVFRAWNSKIQHDLLWLLATELQQAQNSLRAERSAAIAAAKPRGKA